MSRSRKQRKQKTASRRTSQTAPVPAPRSAPTWAIALVAACFLLGVGGGWFVRRQTLARLASNPPTDAANSATPQPTRPATASRASDATDLGRSSSAVASESALQGTPGSSLPDSHALRRAEQQFGALFRQGYQNFHQERYAQALDQFQRAIELAPHLAEGHYYLGQTFAKMMMYDKAEQAYRAALQRMTDFRPAEEQLCMLLHERGDYQEAITRLTRMLDQNPQDTFVLGELAINRLAIGDATAAVPLLQQFNRLGGQQAWGLAHLGRAYDAQGDAAAAESHYRQALEADPFFSLAHYWLGLLLGREGRPQESQESLARYARLRQLLNTEHTLSMALLQDASDVDTLLRLAQVRYEVGKRKEALATLQRARQLAPGHPGVTALSRQWAGPTPY